MDPLTYQQLLHEIEKVRGECFRTFNPEDIPHKEISDTLSLTDNPPVSVLMITYNHEAYIHQAIEGVLKQETNFDIELVIGEDCSTDGTREIILNYQKKHPDIIRIITSDQNVGGRQNGLRTLRACRGKYIAICEGDDYWLEPKKLQIQYNFLNNHPEYGLVKTDFDAYDTKLGIHRRNVVHRRYRTFNSHIEPMAIFLSILDQRYFPRSCTVMVVKQLLDQVISSDAELHRSNRFLMGDAQKWSEIALLSKVHYIDLSTATYRYLMNSTNSRGNIIGRAAFFLSWADLRLYLAVKHGCPKAVIQYYWEHFLRQALWYGVLSMTPSIINTASSAMPNLSIKQRFFIDRAIWRANYQSH